MPQVANKKIKYGLKKKEKKKKKKEFLRGSAITDLTKIQEDTGSIPALTQWIKDLALR